MLYSIFFLVVMGIGSVFVFTRRKDYYLHRLVLIKRERAITLLRAAVTSVSSGSFTTTLRRFAAQSKRNYLVKNLLPSQQKTEWYYHFLSLFHSDQAMFDREKHFPPPHTEFGGRGRVALNKTETAKKSNVQAINLEYTSNFLLLFGCLESLMVSGLSPWVVWLLGKT